LRTVFVFLDGVGIGPPDPARNPFLRADLPTLGLLLGGVPTVSEPTLGRPGTKDVPEAVAFPLDARLATPGIPQSGTGQTSLLTGANAARRFGRHFGPWTPVRLRPLLERKNILGRARRAGYDVAFANAYPRGWPGEPSRRRLAAPPLAASSAGLLTRHAEALGAAQAVSSEIVNDGWIDRLGHVDLPRPTPAAAGATLAGVASSHDLTFFAHYGTDHAGHRGGMAGAVAALELVDAFLAGILERIPRETLVLVASDHGNIEDVSAGHTRNPALGLLVGPASVDRSRRLRSITQVTPAVLSWLRE
jgi:2,3-bisphosphoglycerate-independent phosphoglycerate mutase